MMNLPAPRRYIHPAPNEQPFSRYAKATPADELNVGDLVVHAAEAWELAYIAPHPDPARRSIRLRDPKNFSRIIKGSCGYMLVLAPHYPTCGSCGGLWPCLEQRRETEGNMLMWELRNRCAHCDRPMGSKKEARFTTPEGIDRRYHWAKSYAGCRRAAIREASGHGITLVDNGWSARPAKAGA